MGLLDVGGIGPVTAERLEAAGIRDEHALAAADPETVAEATGRSLDMAALWIGNAESLVGHVETEPEPGTRKRPGIVGWDILLGLDLGYLAITVLFGILLFALMSAGLDLGGDGATESDVDEATLARAVLWITNVHNLVVFAVVPITWIYLTHHGRWEGVRRFLGLERPSATIPIGLAYGVGLAVLFGAIAILLDRLGLTPDQAPIEDTVQYITWPLVIATSLVAGFAEEVMFRGVLQKWLRWWGQALVFGVLHLGNAGILSFAVTLVIGLLFGYARQRGMSLWTLVAAHAMYDFVLLSSVFWDPTATEGSALASLGQAVLP